MRSSFVIVALLVAGCSGSSEDAKPDNTPTEQASRDEPTSEAPAPTAPEPERPEAAPTIDLDAVEDLDTLFSVTGNVEREQVAGIIGQRKPDIYKCYSDALDANPGMSGRVLVQITSTADGGVASSLIKQSTLKKPTVEQCMVRAIRTWKFPNDPSGGLVVVKYAFQLPP